MGKQISNVFCQDNILLLFYRLKIYVIERIVIHTLNKNDIIKAQQIRQSIKRKYNIITT